MKAVETKLQVSLYEQMLRIRMVEEAIAQLYAEQEMRCPVHLSIGQEAVAVGVCSQLSVNDVVFSGHRCHAHYLAKGGCLRALLAELYGKETGCCRGKGGSMHLTDQRVGFTAAAPIVASTIPIAVGAALGFKMRQENRLAVAFFGEGATEEGVFYESLNFAALKKLPVLFVLENNFYSVYSPLSVRQPEGRVYSEIASAQGVEAWTESDGNDLLSVYTTAAEAIAHIRSGKGPALIAFTTYRWREHCGPNYDNDLGYRKPEEFERWRAWCPVESCRQKMDAHGLILEDAHNQLADKIRKEIDDAVIFAKQSPFPARDQLLTNVWAE